MKKSCNKWIMIKKKKKKEKEKKSIESIMNNSLFNN